MKRRTTTIALIGLAALTAGLATAAPVPQDSTRANPGQDFRNTIENRIIKIYKLSHTSADEVADIVQRVVNMHAGETTAVDSRTNALVVAALAATHDDIAAVLEDLDRPVEPKRPSYPVRIFPVEHVHGGNLVTTMQHLMGSSPFVTIGYDNGSNSIIVRGRTDDMDMAERLIASLDIPTDRLASDEQVTLQVYWLANGVDGLKPLPSQLNEVNAELKRAGVDGLGLVAQTMTQVTTGRGFESEFTAMLNSAWDVSISGESETSGSNYVLELSINARNQIIEPQRQGSGPARTSGPDSVSIGTTIATPGGHFVVLGMTPIRAMDSVFVVRVLN